jgi:hypothetical protein
MEIEEKADEAKKQLFILLCDYFNDGWSDNKIRDINQEGFVIKVDDFKMMNSLPFHFPVSLLTDEFLKESRKLNADIIRSKTVSHVEGW